MIGTTWVSIISVINDLVNFFAGPVHMKMYTLLPCLYLVKVDGLMEGNFREQTHGNNHEVGTWRLHWVLGEIKMAVGKCLPVGVPQTHFFKSCINAGR